MPQQPSPDLTKLLVLVITPGRQDFEDFYEIAKEVLRQANDINVHIVTPNDRSDVIPGYKWKMPTLTISFSSMGKFLAPRGRIIESRGIKKLDQHARFTSLGISTPYTERFVFGRRYDEKDWGEFCVLKPLPLSSTSKGTAKLIRTRRLEHIRPSDFPSDHFLKHVPALVQQFIDTGKKPAYHRVMTLFGKPLLWWRGYSPIERPDLTADDAQIENAIIEPKHENIKKNYLVKDRRDVNIASEFFNFAERMHGAFPNLPLQGNDILKEEKTGKLYAIEINGGGNVWHFSSSIFERSRNQMGGREALVQFFNPWPRAAQVLIEKTRELAN